MSYLLDTHALIWFLEGNQQLSKTAKHVLCNEEASIYLSVVSLWELAIKMSLGKLKLSQSLEQVIEVLTQQNITLLPIKPTHITVLLNLPFHHRDPFDRLLIAQALDEGLQFISNESLFLQYNVNRVW